MTIAMQCMPPAVLQHFTYDHKLGNGLLLKPNVEVSFSCITPSIVMISASCSSQVSHKKNVPSVRIVSEVLLGIFLDSCCSSACLQLFAWQPSACAVADFRLAFMCAVRALAIHLIMRFTVRGDDFPDPDKGGQWNAAALWPANNPLKNISYDQQRKALKGHFLAADIISKKVTHSGRVSAACTMADSGVPHAVSAPDLHHDSSHCISSLIGAHRLLLLVLMAPSTCCNIFVAMVPCPGTTVLYKLVNTPL